MGPPVRLRTVAGTPDSRDSHVPLASHVTARPRQADTSFDSQTIIGRHRRSDPAGAPRRYENPSRRLRLLNQAWTCLRAAAPAPPRSRSSMRLLPVQAMLAVASGARRAPAKSLTRRPSTDDATESGRRRGRARSDQACRRLQGPVRSGRPGFTVRCRSRTGRRALQGGRRGRRHVALGQSGCRVGRCGGRRRAVARHPVG